MAVFNDVFGTDVELCRIHGKRQGGLSKTLQRCLGILIKAREEIDQTVAVDSIITHTL